MHCMYTFTLRVGWTCRLVIRLLNLVLDPWWWSYLVISRSAGRLCLPIFMKCTVNTRVGTLIVATIYLQLIQNRYTFRIFTVLQCSHQHCVQPVASDVEVVGYL